MHYDPELFQGVHECRLCKLGELRLEGGYLPTPALPGKNYEPGGIAVMCEAPGADEEVRGEPLVGKAGRLADQLLERGDLQRVDVLLINRVRCRPPANKLKDWPEAISACDSWTRDELRKYQPAVVVLMGATALISIFGAQAKVGTSRGTFISKDDRHTWGKRLYTCTYHPAAVARAGGIKSELAEIVIADLQAAKKAWEELQ